MVLLGLSPDDCLQAALRGIHFWQHQLERNAANIAATSSYSTGHESALAAQWEKHFQLTVNEMNQEINALREECHSKNILIHVLSFWLSYEFKLIDFIKLTNDIKSWIKKKKIVFVIDDCDLTALWIAQSTTFEFCISNI